MGLCGHCKNVEIAWHHDGKAWVAYVAAVDATGVTARTRVAVGKNRFANRPVPDLGKRHYPHADKHAGPATPDECPVWTLAAAKAHQQAKAKKGGGGKMPMPIVQPMVGLDTEGVGVGVGAEVDTMVAAIMGQGRGPTGGWTQGPAAPVNRPIGDDAVAALRAAMGAASATVGATMPVASGVGQSTLGTVVLVPAVAVPQALPSVSDLMALEDRLAWVRAEKILECGVLPTRLMLWGPPGTGKTELLWRHAQKMGWAHEYQLMTEETPGSDLIGHLAVEGGNTVWLDGSLGRAIRKSHAGPVILAIDEIGRASADALSACLLALTNPESLRLTTRAGEVIAPKVENWHVGVTSNDDPALLPPAIADRLHLAVMLVAPHPGLVESLGTEEARRLACATSREYSIRALLSYDRLRAAGWALKEAAELVWEPQVAKSFCDAVKIAGPGKRQ